MTAIEKILRKDAEERSNRGFANHQNGHAFELKNHNIERRNSILSVHSDGSYGDIDVVAIRKDCVLLIVCKANGYLTPKERRDLDKLKLRLPKFCKIQLRYRAGRKLRKSWY